MGQTNRTHLWRQRRYLPLQRPKHQIEAHRIQNAGTSDPAVGARPKHHMQSKSRLIRRRRWTQERRSARTNCPCKCNRNYAFVCFGRILAFFFFPADSHRISLSSLCCSAKEIRCCMHNAGRGGSVNAKLFFPLTRRGASLH